MDMRPQGDGCFQDYSGSRKKPKTFDALIDAAQQDADQLQSPFTTAFHCHSGSPTTARTDSTTLWVLVTD
eukprot:1863982-Amphidinium_carterae.2